MGITITYDVTLTINSVRQFNFQSIETFSSFNSLFNLAIGQNQSNISFGGGNRMLSHGTLKIFQKMVNKQLTRSYDYPVIKW